MPRKPLGVYVRDTPDWFFRNAASVGANNPGQSGLFAVIDLFNDGSAGAMLYVYKLYIQNSGTFSCRIQQIQGHANGVSGPAYPVRIGAAQPPGTLYIDQISNIDRPNTDPYITSVNAPVVDIIEANGPIAILPPGYSLRVGNNQAAFGFIAWFYYVVLYDG